MQTRKESRQAKRAEEQREQTAHFAAQEEEEKEPHREEPGRRTGRGYRRRGAETPDGAEGTRCVPRDASANVVAVHFREQPPRQESTPPTTSSEEEPGNDSSRCRRRPPRGRIFSRPGRRIARRLRRHCHAMICRRRAQIRLFSLRIRCCNCRCNRRRICFRILLRARRAICRRARRARHPRHYGGRRPSPGGEEETVESVSGQDGGQRPSPTGEEKTVESVSGLDGGQHAQEALEGAEGAPGDAGRGTGSVNPREGAHPPLQSLFSPAEMERGDEDLYAGRKVNPLPSADASQSATSVATKDVKTTSSSGEATASDLRSGWTHPSSGEPLSSLTTSDVSRPPQDRSPRSLLFIALTSSCSTLDVGDVTSVFPAKLKPKTKTQTRRLALFGVTFFIGSAL